MYHDVRSNHIQTSYTQVWLFMVLPFRLTATKLSSLRKQALFSKQIKQPLFFTNLFFPNTISVLGKVSFVNYTNHKFSSLSHTFKSLCIKLENLHVTYTFEKLLFVSLNLYLFSQRFCNLK